jgi:hypothetical protein
MNIDDLTIGQARRLAAMFSQNATPKPEQRIDHGLQIAVLDRGFVYIGNVATDGEWCYIANAWNIRRWGTTRGLGELVNGPLTDTVLDRVGDVRMPMTTLQHLIAVEDLQWHTKLD